MNLILPMLIDTSAPSGVIPTLQSLFYFPHFAVRRQCARFVRTDESGKRTTISKVVITR